MTDVKTCLSEAQDKMDMATMYLEESLAHIRAGKADVRLLDGIRVESYGSMVPINNVASVNTPDARSIAIKPWDKSMFRPIEKAIIDSDLGIMPENNGEIIRIGIPPLTEERRKQLANLCIFGFTLTLLSELLTAFFGQWRNTDADNFTIVFRHDTEV